MKFLIVNHYFDETYFTDKITKEDIVAVKNRDMDMLIDLERESYFDPEENKWVIIKLKEVK